MLRMKLRMVIGDRAGSTELRTTKFESLDRA